MIKFINKETVLTFHRDQIKTYGGKQGIRDEELLESVLAQPKATFEGEYVHNTIFHMAEAYGFYLAKNHSFLGGNKRTALVAIYTFLYVNGYRIEADKKSLYAVMIDLANGKVEKEELANFLEENSKKKV